MASLALAEIGVWVWAKTDQKEYYFVKVKKKEKNVIKADLGLLVYLQSHLAEYLGRF